MDNRKELAEILRRITSLRTEMVGEYPFFGRLLLHLTPAVAVCGTACTDMEKIIFDPGFAKRLPDEELKFVMLHEVMHCVLKHCVRGRTLDRELYNVACDIVVNSMIFESMGVSTFSVDGEVPMHLTPDNREGRMFSAEEVYDMLLKKGAVKTPLKNGNRKTGNVNGAGSESGDQGDGAQKPSSDKGDGVQNPSAGKGDGAQNPSSDKGNGAQNPSSDKGNGAQNPSAGKGDGVQNPSADKGNAMTGRSGSGGGVDNHDIWDEIKTADKQRLEDIWEIRIQAASKRCGSGSGIPQNIKRHIDETAHMPRTNWKQVLADFIRHEREDYTFQRRDVRYSGDIIMPSFMDNMYGDSVSELWLCVDTSGSISDEMLGKVYAEILSASSQLDSFSGKIAFFDTKLSDFFPFESEDDIRNIRPTGGGGTSFQCIFDRLAECEDDELPVGIVILTDGFAPFPDEEDALNVPVLWVIIDSDVEPKWGTAIYIKE